MGFVDVILTLGAYPKMNSHSIGKLWPNISKKMKYLNFDVNLIATNEKKIQ
jgi:hypothetical protein